MVQTRSQVSSMEAIEAVIDKKLDELKEGLLSEIKVSFEKYVNEKKDELKLFIETEKKEFLNSEHFKSVQVIQNHVKKLQQQVKSLKEENIMLTTRVDDLQQYVRRPNLRIFGAPVSANESSDDVKRLVENIMDVNDLEIPKSSIDRAHRIGKVVSSNVDENVKIQPIIVRFTSFRDRTVFYRARKEIKKKLKYGTSVDLTVDRLAMLREARKVVETVEGIKFAYADINCNLRVLTENGKHLSFNSIKDLHAIIENL